MSLLRKIQVFSANVAKLWTIDEANTARTTSTIVGAVQVIDQAGKVSPAGDTLANAPYAKSTVYNSGGTEIFTSGNPGAVSDGGGSLTVDGTVTITFPQAKPEKVTLTAGVDYTVKNSAGYVCKIVTSLDDLYAKNNTTIVWRNGYTNGCPMYFDTKIVLSSVAGGDVYIVYI